MNDKRRPGSDVANVDAWFAAAKFGVTSSSWLAAVLGGVATSPQATAAAAGQVESKIDCVRGTKPAISDWI